VSLRSVFRQLLFLTAPALLLLFVLLEVLFRTVVPATDEPYAIYDPTDRILRYDPTRHTDGLHTVGPGAEDRARWHINNAGWNSEIDYSPPEARRLPLVAVIGDSYVEALNVDTDESFVALLRRRLPGRSDVYSIGKGGAPLSQYLQEIRYARRRFRPSVLVVNVVHNDFTECFRERSIHPHFLHVRVNGGEVEEVPPEPYRPSELRRLVYRSALVRYVWLNLKVQLLFSSGAAAIAREGTEPREEQTAVAPDVRAATQWLVGRILDENQDTRILFVIDGPRADIYKGRTPTGTHFLQIRLMSDVCARLGCDLLDLTQTFTESWRQDGRPFNSPWDYHWNEHGHRVVAEAVYRRLEEDHLLPVGPH